MTAMAAAQNAARIDIAICLSVFSNPDGQAVGKVYELGPDSKPQKVKRGNPFARHCKVHRFDNAFALATFIHSIGADTHICAGIPRDGIEEAPVTTMGSPRVGAIARSNAFFEMRRGPGVLVLDLDVRAETPAHCRLDTNAFKAALATVLGWPAESTPRVSYPSSSSFVECADGSASTGLRGHHSLVLVADVTDVPRALSIIFQRFILAGYGWVYIGADGRQHLRSLVDETVGRDACRAIYSGPAELGAGLQYGSRGVSYVNGDLLDTRTAVPQLTATELAQYESTVAALFAASAEEAGSVRAAHKLRNINAMVSTGVSERDAAAAYAGTGVQRLEGPWPIVLASGATVTVDDILDARDRYHNQPCCDPVENTYDGGRTVAKIYTDRSDVFISSMAHGGQANGGPTVYVLSRSAIDDFEMLPAELVADNDASDASDASDVDAAPTAVPFTVTPFAEQRLGHTDARDGTRSTRPLSELGNASRLFDAEGNRLRYVFDAESWLIWSDCAWAWDFDGAAVRALASQLPKLIYAEGIGHPNDAAHFAKWSRISQQQRTIRAAASLLADNPGVRIPLAYMDANPMLVGFDQARQVIDLTNGSVRPATPLDYITKSLVANSVGDATKAVRWVAFLDQVFKGDVELIDWLHRFCGYMLSGSTEAQFWVFLAGAGANGKSVFIEMLKHIMGDYARVIATETLTDAKRQAGAATPDLVALIGARLGVCSETEDNRALAESLVKSLVAGDTMSGRQLQKGQLDFKPVLKLVMSGNHKPVIKGSDHGMWRRVRLVPCTVTFSAEQRDPNLLEKLKAETSHILAWMRLGCIAWQQRGLSDTPKAIESATGEYKTDQDTLGRWLTERTTASGETPSGELYDDYRYWCAANGVHPHTNIVFGRRLGDRGFDVRQSNGVRFWRGVTLLHLSDVFPVF